MSKHIVILGAGYGGLLSALTLRKYVDKSEAKITVVNQYPTHQIITELHRLAAGNISEQAIAMPLEKLFKGKDIDLKISKVTSFSVDKKEIILADSSMLKYDRLVVALGSVTSYFGIPGLEENSMVLKSTSDANKIHKHIEGRLQEYAKTQNEADATILIGGGGLTGVELVGEIVDTIPGLAKKYGIDPKELKIMLVEAGPKILPVLPDHLIERATTSLEKRGVKYVTGLPVTNVEGNTVDLKDGQKIVTNTFVWTGGVQGNPLVGESGLEVNRGRATVNEHLQSVSHPDVFVVGDSAVLMAPNGRPYAPTAQNAWQMGELVGYNVFASLEGKKLEEFSPVDSGTLASLGRKDAVAIIGGNQTPLKGLPASMMKEASNIRYLSHIKGLFSLAY
ncbi:NAD(P)/FAD-dependent oxidoreductase [Heyndrickxia sporothermodurans]|uniref:NAD(P)/FAD-dependent oxidoreductase n=1 Tax=Heyndrickxia sporothermodurans TaxID=46224 RepID=A0AB37HBB2_9BACI|nr:NAD(P)/FAD-dependent oxidoreductase [Heyndrickxia sporothermodurans]MBL5767745.1 NAD(P)/FAD-dependent oxidoreductase [Heyndrickxia sporothermodurans]MBL5771251.1 NAD(P)/FAD-dependent oxidoreductase [Heyndrickxia sporothermodurans]MBL5775725.1 NAD(P)/FAD-dependent oxidoreductase [Heyndrickxia sporothermodurans]MBL5779206.1 NAD(P)/FAD-dependent oxidoreductase [Heyndrickxia sporothermodurans]MBL5785621.1 NAD(P)/FAD-dependent oxidoreductase [Heyndrickxia sporothermodurans]